MGSLNLSVCSLLHPAFGVRVKKYLPSSTSRFFSWNFIALGLTFRPMVHFELIFYMWYEAWIKVHTFAYEYPVIEKLH